LRAPLGPSVRVRYHRASALSFWNIKKGYLAHQTQLGAEPCLSFLVLECCSLECCSRRRPQLDTVRHLTGRDQTPQRYQQLVWDFLCQGCITPFLSCFVASFFCSTRAASILPSRPHIAVAVARSGGQGRRFFSAAEGLSLTDASTAAGCP
jgi:hypothetical protein